MSRGLFIHPLHVRAWRSVQRTTRALLAFLLAPRADLSTHKDKP